MRVIHVKRCTLYHTGCCQNGMAVPARSRVRFFDQRGGRLPTHRTHTVGPRGRGGPGAYAYASLASAAAPPPHAHQSLSSESSEGARANGVAFRLFAAGFAARPALFARAGGAVLPLRRGALATGTSTSSSSSSSSSSTSSAGASLARSRRVPLRAAPPGFNLPLPPPLVNLCTPEDDEEAFTRPPPAALPTCAYAGPAPLPRK